MGLSLWASVSGKELISGEELIDSSFFLDEGATVIACSHMETTIFWRPQRSWSAFLNSFKRTGSLVIDAKYDLFWLEMLTQSTFFNF